VQQVLPRFFKSRNFNSFQRQLNYFGFNKTSKDIIQYSLDLFHADASDDILLMKRKVKTVSVGGVSMLTRKVIAALVTSRDKKWAAVYKEECLYSGRGRTESPSLTSKQRRSGPDLTDDGRENKLAVRPENKLAVRPDGCHFCRLPRLTAEPWSNYLARYEGRGAFGPWRHLAGRQAAPQ
jgi:hypothetical protein